MIYPLAIFGLGVPELLIILAVVLLLFGGSRLAGLGKSTGRALKEFKEETKGLKDEKGDPLEEGQVPPPAAQPQAYQQPPQVQSAPSPQAYELPPNQVQNHQVQNDYQQAPNNYQPQAYQPPTHQQPQAYQQPPAAPTHNPDGSEIRKDV